MDSLQTAEPLQRVIEQPCTKTDNATSWNKHKTEMKLDDEMIKLEVNMIELEVRMIKLEVQMRCVFTAPLRVALSRAGMNKTPD